MKFRIYILLIIQSIIFSVTSVVNAQPQLTASVNKNQVNVNSSFQVVYSLTGGRAVSFTKPDFGNFSMVGSSHTSGGGMTVIVNGQLVQGGNDEEKWIFTLIPSSAGKFIIGPAKAKVGSEWIQSNSLTIEVGNTSSSQNNTQQNSSNNNSSKSSGDNEVFLKAFVNKSNPVQGEQIIITYKIYTKVPVTQYVIQKLSGFNGFWSYDLLKDQKNVNQYQETVNGEKYTVAELRKYALFPQKSGRLVIDPLEVECVVQIVVKGSNSVFDAFFNDPFFKNSFFNNQNFQNPFSSVQEVKKNLKSNSLIIDVAQLPSTGRPADFSGAVGSFTFEANMDKSEVKQNEAVSMKLTVNGSGNISLIDKPKIEFPPDFEVYDPEISDNISFAGNKISGTRTYEFLIIPRVAGDFTIKPVQFNYYDLQKKAYITVSTPEFPVRVHKGDATSNPGYGGSGKEDVKYIGSDVRYINDHDVDLYSIGSFFFHSLTYYVILSICLILFIAFLVVWRRRLILNNNIVLQKNLRATRIARKRLKLAGVFMKNSDENAFYVEISRALWGYISDKFNVPQSEISIENAKEIFESREFSPELVEKLINSLNNCEYARFAPAGSSLSMQSVYEDAANLITSVENILK